MTTDWPLVSPPDPRIDYKPALRQWEVEEPFVVRFRGKRADLPRGFRAEPSIPRLLWWYIAPHELGTRGPSTHDRLYRALRRHFTRAEADLLFLVLMLNDGVEPEKAVKAYLAVRRFGWWAWYWNGVKARRAHRKAMRRVRR